MLLDNHGRQINYLRLAVTDRCNLRCFYCMPENGIRFVHRKDLLTYEEMHRLVRVFSELGVNKIRITGYRVKVCRTHLSIAVTIPLSIGWIAINTQ